MDSLSDITKILCCVVLPKDLALWYNNLDYKYPTRSIPQLDVLVLTLLGFTAVQFHIDL